MSLGENTKCDLSAGLAKLDLVTLTKQTEYYYYMLLDKMRKKVVGVQYDTTTLEDRKKTLASMSSTGSKDVMRLAQNIAEVTELLHTLYETAGREIEIIR